VGLEKPVAGILLSEAVIWSTRASGIIINKSEVNPVAKEIVTTRKIARFDMNRGLTELEDVVVSEQALTIHVNGSELVTLLCTPEHLGDLAIGYLAGEGFIKDPDDIMELKVNQETGECMVLLKGSHSITERTYLKRYVTTGCGKGISFYQLADARLSKELPRDYRLQPAMIIDMMRTLLENSNLHRDTGGVHTVALGQNGRLLIQRDDIGRHNAVDKVFGYCLRNNVNTEDKALVISGRISSEIALKAVKMRIQILISKSAPTDMAIEFAEDLGLTLVGFTRGSRFNIYTHSYRIA
jgi:FdhD protein